MHPANAAFRFLLELCAIGFIGWWGASLPIGVVRLVVMIVAPLAACAAWGIFAVPKDPSRGGTPVVVVPGPVRLALELTILLGPAWLVYGVGHTSVAAVYGVAVLVHHVFSWRRLRWLLQQ